MAIRGAYDHAESANHLGSPSEPAFLTTAQHFPSAEAMAAAAAAATANKADEWVYSRRGNPTVRFLQDTVAAFDGYQVEAEVSSVLGLGDGMRLGRAAAGHGVDPADACPLGFGRPMAMMSATVREVRIRAGLPRRGSQHLACLVRADNVQAGSGEVERIARLHGGS